MKKISFLILSSFVTAFFFTAVPPVYAEKKPREKDTIKIYYSEPIGAGEKVYHLTACQKSKAYTGLKCHEKNADDVRFSNQCKPKGNFIKGHQIRGCVIKDDFVDSDKAYPKVNPARVKDTKEQGGCSDAADEQAPYYVPEWAILQTKDNKGKDLKPNQWIIKTRIGWPTKPDGDLIAEFAGVDKEDIGKYKARESYRPTLCVSWDIIAESRGAKKKDQEDIPKNIDKKGTELINSVKSDAKKLTDKNCNNDNSDESPNFALGTSGPPKPSISCSIRERISGSSGSDIFGQYIGAIYKWAAGVVGIVAVLTMVYSGIQISMAGGDSAKLDSAKQRIMQSLIGLALLFLSGLILYTINPGFFTG